MCGQANSKYFESLCLGALYNTRFNEIKHDMLYIKFKQSFDRSQCEAEILIQGVHVCVNVSYIQSLYINYR